MEQRGGGAYPKYLIVYVIGAWGFTSLKKLNYPNECIEVNIGHKVVIIIHVRSVITRVFRRIKIFIIVLYKMVDFIEVIRIKIVSLDAEVSFDRFGKKLRFISVSLNWRFLDRVPKPDNRANPLV